MLAVEYGYERLQSLGFSGGAGLFPGDFPVSGKSTPKDRFAVTASSTNALIRRLNSI
jgi:hypothetical protein